ncbi:hypothetical protein N3K66_005334 [Trichothecium roseum]|uniref:Uncharacterized protein n=1 Tax=Trichothecium roseum TaxID=47278 RepID=A0ACC0UXN6_9HYPO|nr:hypothetical protein N3K66_005334 [Trichothecium roseum]
MGRKRELVPHGTVVHRITIDESLIRDAPNLRHLVAEDDPNTVVWLGPGSQAVTYSLDGIFNIAFTRPWRPATKGGGDDDDAPFYGPQRRMFFEPEIDGEETPWVRGVARFFCLVGDAAHQTLPYLAQGAAMGLESSSVLSHLLGRARRNDRGQIRAALGVYERMSKERSGWIIRASLENGRVWQLPDGPAQEERGRQLLAGGEGPGFPNMLADPDFREWLWGFDAAKAAGEAWEAYLSWESGEIGRARGLLDGDEASSLVFSRI